MDKEFLKTLTILYVEDEPNIREDFYSSIKNVFKEVLVAADGKEALDIFNENENLINLIISDINMPKMNGIEFLKEVKKINSNIPFIFTTAYSDEKYLIEGIKNKVSDYFLKPASLIEIIQKIEHICLKKQVEEKIRRYQNETKEYFDLINKVAIVYIFDKEGNLTYTNDFLNELLNIKDSDELIGQDYKSIFHSDMPKEILNKQWEELLNNQKWNGKLKYITKQNTTFYANATIIPTQDEKFISINFLTTKEENERRAYKKQLLYNIQEAKKIFKVAQGKIDSLNKALEHFKGYEKKEEQLVKLKEKTKKNFLKLQACEKKIKSIKNRFEQLTLGVNSKISKVAIATNNMKEETQRNSKKIYKLKDDIHLREQFIEKIKLDIDEKKARVIDLENILNHSKNTRVIKA